VVQHAELQALARDSLSALKRRGIVRKEFIDRLARDYLPQHPAYFGEMIWILMMLEQWARRPESALPERSAYADPRPFARTSD
jgi:asparagine synthase (glutamine-hydrolysing)